MPLEAHTLAEEGFDQSVEAMEGRDAQALADELLRRAEEAEQMDPWAEERIAYRRASNRGRMQEAFDSPEGLPDPATAKRVGVILRKTATAVQTSMKGSTVETMEDGVAGKGQLDSDRRWIDPLKAKHSAAGGDVLIDVSKAVNTNRHEEEHNRQSLTADAASIRIGNQRLEEWEVREAGAISVQDRIDFLSGHYRWIHSVLPVNAAERDLIRRGEFRELERRKNGGRVPEPSLN